MDKKSRRHEIPEIIGMTKAVKDKFFANCTQNDCHFISYGDIVSYPLVADDINLSTGAIYFSTPQGGGFSTHIPISSLEYRLTTENSPVKWEILIEEDTTLLVRIVSDYGDNYYVIILNEEVQKKGVVDSVQKIKEINS